MPLYQLELCRLLGLLVAAGPFLLIDPASVWLRGSAFVWMVVVLCEVAVLHPLIRAMETIREGDYHLGPIVLGGALLLVLALSSAFAFGLCIANQWDPWDPTYTLLFCGVVGYVFPFIYSLIRAHATSDP